MEVKIQKLSKTLDLPAYQTKGSAGFDLSACFDSLGDNSIIKIYKEIEIEKQVNIWSVIELAPGERALIPCGFKVSIPEGYEMEIRPRSGKATKSGLTIVNSPGTIDSDYRGEIKLGVINLGKLPVEIGHGERLAQGLLKKVEIAEFLEVESLDDTERGEGGFGSTN